MVRNFWINGTATITEYHREITQRFTGHGVRSNLFLVVLVLLSTFSVQMAHDVELNTLPPTYRGFRILGAAASDYSGNSVSAAGDVNGDGVDDVLVGAYGADPVPGGSGAGISYVIFCHKDEGGAAAFHDMQLTASS